MSACLTGAAICSLAQQKESVRDSFYTLSPVEVRAIRAGENAPFTKSLMPATESATPVSGSGAPMPPGSI